MSLAPFANLEQRLNRAVLGRLANAVAVVGGVDVPVLFERPYAGPFGGEVDAVAPACIGPLESLGDFERGDELVIDGATYVVQKPEPDGTGFVRLVLGEA